jgi:hypothetical protein
VPDDFSQAKQIQTTNQETTMSKSQVKKISARIETLSEAVKISRANAKSAQQAKFRKLAAAKAARLSVRVKKLQAKLVA